jgi:hypothetical protein
VIVVPALYVMFEWFSKSKKPAETPPLPEAPSVDLHGDSGHHSST